MDLLTDMLSSFFVSTNIVPRNTSIITSFPSAMPSTTPSSSSTSSTMVLPLDDSSSDTTSEISDALTLSSSSSSSSSSDGLDGLDGSDGKISKCIIRGREISLKNVMIINDDRKDNVMILGDILDRLSKLLDVEDIYSKKIYIMVLENDMSKYRKMLLENPYLHFMDYDIKRGFSEIKDKYEKKTIYVIDCELLYNVDVDKITSRDDIHLIIVGNVYNDKVCDIYNKINCRGDGILINRRSRIELLQKQFYKNVVKGICKDGFLNFEEYYKKINDENLNVRWVIIDDTQLMYN